ncbi:MAG: 16S rRNA (cytosine(1402)-N(4))-methyltransferase RsmH [Planctomycetes bacterium]|nr:16S rRNA (cytosine(1402)-N(4))-methyltransferase RsmH [Planctomycetota bacterium]
MPDAGARSVHEPVQVETVLRYLQPAEGSTILDLTIGAGGHAEKILEASRSGRVIGLDLDPGILEIAGRRLERFGARVALRQANFADAGEVCSELGIDAADGVLLDLGVSSLQLDDARRGFSFDRDGPLDMRMDPGAAFSAADLVNRGTREELLHAIGALGEEPQARRIVAAILAARRQAPLRRTCELVDLIAREARGPRHHHPATRTFLGLRMAVNDELGALRRALPQALALLRPGGRAVVIAFHGGEDALVKRCFQEAARRGAARVLTRRPVPPEGAEVARNPRARSSRVRAAERVRSEDETT